MVFSKLARLLAIACLVLGLLSLTFGLSVATGALGPYDEVVARYGTSGRAIDRGIYTILVAVALGTLAEISFSLRKAFGLNG
jgi:hypothetical protein